MRTSKLKGKRRKSPAWIERYKKEYEEGRITKEEIFRRENAEREASNKPLLKFKSVTRSLNALGFSYGPFKSVQREREEEKPPEVPSSSPSKPCYGCKYYTKKAICVYPGSMFQVYPELSDFDKDFMKGRCKLKKT